MLRSEAMSVVGDFVTRALEATSINKGFFGGCGISLERGLTDLNPDEVGIKRELAEACEIVVAVVDHTKWHRTGLLSFVPARRIDAIITDDDSPTETVEQWRRRDVEVVTAVLEDDLTRLGDRTPSP